MDAGLYSIAADQLNLDAARELIVFDTVKRACTGVTLSAGVFTFAAGTYLILPNYSLTRTSATAGSSCAIGWFIDPTGTPMMYGGFTAQMVCSDQAAGLGQTMGCGPIVVTTKQALTLGPCLHTVTSGQAFTVDSAFTSVCIINLDTFLAGVGLYYMAGDQSGLNTAGEQIVYDSTHQACSGVTLSGGVFTFASGSGKYVVFDGTNMRRSAGTGTTLSTQFTTDSATPGTTAYATMVPNRYVTADATTLTGNSGGCMAVVDTTGGAVSIGPNVLAQGGDCSATAESTNSYILVWKLTS